MIQNRFAVPRASCSGCPNLRTQLSCRSSDISHPCRTVSSCNQRRGKRCSANRSDPSVGSTIDRFQGPKLNSCSVGYCDWTGGFPSQESCAGAQEDLCSWSRHYPHRNRNFSLLKIRVDLLAKTCRSTCRSTWPGSNGGRFLSRTLARCTETDS